MSVPEEAFSCVCVDRRKLPLLANPACVFCRGTGIKDKTREKIVARNVNRRIPTPEDFAAFDGMHCKALYRSLPSDWTCPSCKRSLFEVLRWTMLYPNRPTRFEGWAGGFHRHHDHSRTPRFSEMVICEQCNSADGAVKRKLGLPADFSFSPDEIGQFVIATPHGWHLIDYAKAAAIHHEISSLDRRAWWHSMRNS